MSCRKAESHRRRLSPRLTSYLQYNGLKDLFKCISKLMVGRIRVIVDLPGARDLSPQPHVDRAAVGRDASHCLTRRQADVGPEDVALTLDCAHVQPVGRRAGPG